MFLVASHLLTRHRRLLGVVLLLAAVMFTAGWPALASFSAAAGNGVASVERVAVGNPTVPANCPADGQYQWCGHPFAVPNPGQSHQGQLPPIRLAMAFGESAWNTVAADVCCAVVVTEQLAGAAKTTRHVAPLWGSLQVREVRLQI